MDVRLKRVYDAAAPDDGYRVLVDRLWPRGVSKERAALDSNQNGWCSWGLTTKLIRITAEVYFYSRLPRNPYLSVDSQSMGYERVCT